MKYQISLDVETIANAMLIELAHISITVKNKNRKL